MKKKRYTVMLDDNFHYMDEEHRYKYGEFSTCEKAVAACKKIVDEDLRDMLKQGVKLEELSATWSLYGSDPYIVGGSSRFSARDYVTEKTQELGDSQQEWRWWRGWFRWRRGLRR
jgi:hypothetical protein